MAPPVFLTVPGRALFALANARRERQGEPPILDDVLPLQLQDELMQDTRAVFEAIGFDQLLAAARDAQCPCSIRERDSGHLTDCWMPALLEAIALAEGRRP